ncbi:hypothetical protein CEXT_28441 [Caerostris extrusa]|uniref:Uncharacterized protein n=1 Tax=Caerostris extrusa TaxID=172846 RepID=A0AAV4TH76_CAEEX|nr:hypothetical protein CEXT_28441 [Caerostris extrusa]
MIFITPIFLAHSYIRRIHPSLPERQSRESSSSSLKLFFAGRERKPVRIPGLRSFKLILPIISRSVHFSKKEKCPRALPINFRECSRKERERSGNLPSG